MSVGRLDGLDRRERLAWGGALALFGVGDVATTGAGLALGAVETNPVALAAFEAVGVWPAMVGVKLAVLGFALGGWWCCPSWGRAVAPGALAGIGAVVVVSNAAVLSALLPPSTAAVGVVAVAWGSLAAVEVRA